MENTNSTAATTTSAISKTDQMMNRMKISSSTYIAERFPINSLQQITLLPNHEVVTGRVYCTDEMTRTVILQKALTYTTLSCEIRIIAVNNILNAQQLPEKGTTTSGENGNNKETTEDIDTVRATPLMQPLPIIQKKVLEERERRAIRLAEESLRHINPKASSVGQAVFERLLKACGDAIWKDDSTSIIVLNHIQVDAPYQPENCHIIKATTTQPQNSLRKDTATSGGASNNNGNGGSLEDVSLDRVKKIVASTVSVVAETTNESSKTN